MSIDMNLEKPVCCDIFQFTDLLSAVKVVKKRFQALEMFVKAQLFDSKLRETKKIQARDKVVQHSCEANGQEAKAIE